MMISYSDALEVLKQNTLSLNDIDRPIIEALGNYCSQDVFAPFSIPSFDNSAMDGFGVKSLWLQGASKENPISITKSYSIAAGETNDEAGEFAVHIMTGARVPEWVDGIVPVENTQEVNGEIVFTAPINPGENIRKIGTDIAKGINVLGNGQRIGAEHIAILAALGIARVRTKLLPKLTIFSTGNEIVAHDSGALKNGQIYNSNAPYLVSRAKEAGLFANYGGQIKDDKNEFIKHIKETSAGSIIITTGAVSMGKYDFIPSALFDLGAQIHFHKCNIRPGKPILFASLPNGSIFFGLPGNPISSAIGFNFFVLKYLEFCLGLTCENQKAILENNFSKPAPFRQFVKAWFGKDGKIEILEGQESYKILPMVKANAWAILPEEKHEFHTGEILEFIPYGASL